MMRRAAEKGQESKRCHSMKHDCDSNICKPSSGFFALIFAAQMCNRVRCHLRPTFPAIFRLSCFIRLIDGLQVSSSLIPDNHVRV